MPTHLTSSRSHRPKAMMVFAAAFVAGAVAAVGINRALDVHLAQAKPKVDCEPIFVALRSLPQGTPLTIYDVALKDWPKAMLPSTALRAHDQFEGMILQFPVREGQPLLSVQLVKVDAAPAVAQPAAPALAAVQLPPAALQEADLWSSTVAPAATAPTQPEQQPAAVVEAPAAPPAPEATVANEPTIAEPVVDAEPPAAAAAEAVSVITGPPAAPPVVAQPAATTPAVSPPAARYLVVPERIAMQADSSFVSPAAPVAQSVATDAINPNSLNPTKPTTSAPTAVSPAPTTNVPPVIQDPGRRDPAKRRSQAAQPPVNTTPQAARQRSAQPRPQARPQATPRPQQQQQQQPGQPQPAATKRPAGMFGSMFPNIRAGIDAVEAEIGSLRRGRSDQEEAAATLPQPGPQPPSQAAAGWRKMGSGSTRAF